MKRRLGIERWGDEDVWWAKLIWRIKKALGFDPPVLRLPVVWDTDPAQHDKPAHTDYDRLGDEC